MVRRRQTKQPVDQSTSEDPPIHAAAAPTTTKDDDAMSGVSSWSARSQWLFFAAASGACAAFNGVFAKLTTTELTTTLSNAVANFLGLSSMETVVEVVVRAVFFILNLTFNGVMWSLFTTALARGTSTTQVSIINTSANFMLTAILGFVIFSESLPPMWWGGAALLVIGTVITGRQDEAVTEAGATPPPADGEYATVPQQERDSEDGAPKKYQDETRGEDEDVIDLGDLESERR